MGAAGAVFVGTRKAFLYEVSEEIAGGAGMFSIDLVHHRSASNGNAKQPIKTSNSALAMMWVSNSMLLTVPNDAEGDGED